LAFHPELLKGTCLGMRIDEYTFLNYNNNEALHISQREKKIFMRCLENVNEELHRCIDRHSRELVTKSIDLLLVYCSRFYERQFIVRNEVNKCLMKKTDKFINEYYLNGKGKSKDLSPTKYFADLLGMSPAYFTDLLKHETGHTVTEYIQAKRMEIAKKWLRETDKTVANIATTLSFSSLEYFCRLLKKVIGYTPDEYRKIYGTGN